MHYVCMLNIYINMQACHQVHCTCIYVYQHIWQICTEIRVQTLQSVPLSDLEFTHVCIHIRMYAYIYECMYTYTHVCIHIFTCVIQTFSQKHTRLHVNHVSKRLHPYIHTYTQDINAHHMYVCVHVCAGNRVDMCATCMYVCMYVCMHSYIHTYIHQDINTHHTQTHNSQEYGAAQRGFYGHLTMPLQHVHKETHNLVGCMVANTFQKRIIYTAVYEPFTESAVLFLMHSILCAAVTLASNVAEIFMRIPQ